MLCPPSTTLYCGEKLYGVMLTVEYEGAMQTFCPIFDATPKRSPYSPSLVGGQHGQVFFSGGFAPAGRQSFGPGATCGGSVGIGRIPIEICCPNIAANGIAVILFYTRKIYESVHLPPNV
jgi:hypothetical protein